jgi:hypothetical protein
MSYTTSENSRLTVLAVDIANFLVQNIHRFLRKSLFSSSVLP